MNLALPGAGSLAAGRKVGYPQVILGLVGLGLTMVCGLKFLLWYLANFSNLTGNEEDPLAGLSLLWHQLRWPALGVAVFVVAMLWALLTSLTILSQAGSAAINVPPRLTQ